MSKILISKSLYNVTIFRGTTEFAYPIHPRLRVVEKKTTTTKKAKHGAGACRFKVCVYYDEFKVIFLMLL
jgi:hypothetical protein